MSATKLFRSNRSQAVRLPKAAEFPAGVQDVVIRSVGGSRIISPANAVWDDFFDAPSVDLGSREQPVTQERQRW